VVEGALNGVETEQEMLSEVEGCGLYGLEGQLDGEI
jgi:hypothetical protein